MKKIIAAFILFVSFSFTANAQEIKSVNSQERKQSTEVVETRKVDFNDLAKKDTHTLTKLIQLDEQKIKDLNGLFLYKHEALNKAKETRDKEQISTIIEAKLRATLSPEQMEKVANQPNLLHQLTH